MAVWIPSSRATRMHSAARRICSSACVFSAGPNAASTCSVRPPLPEGGVPMPILSRGKASVPRLSTRDRKPRCPPSLPDGRIRRVPSGRATSSQITSKSGRAASYCSKRQATASPLAFIYVSGCATKISCEPSHPRAIRDRHWCFLRSSPWRRQNSSTARKPRLWRVCRYSSPGFPRPTTILKEEPSFLLPLLLGLLLLGLPLLRRSFLSRFRFLGGRLTLLDDLRLGDLCHRRGGNLLFLGRRCHHRHHLVRLGEDLDLRRDLQVRHPNSVADFHAGDVHGNMIRDVRRQRLNPNLP